MPISIELKELDDVAYSTNLLSKLYLNEKALKKAKIFLDSTQRLADRYHLIDVKRQNLYYISEYYRQLGNFKKQSEYLNQYIIIKDSLLNIEKAHALAEMQTKYESEKKDREIIYMQNMDKLRLSEIDYHRKRSVFLLVAASIFFIVALIILYLFQINKKRKRHIEHLNQEMQHRINNNLQLLSGILKMQTDDSDTAVVIKTTQSRLNAMAIVHQKLYKQKEQRIINVHDYLSELCKFLEFSFRSDNQLKIITNIESIKIDVDQVVYLGLIVNELVTNAIKYAFRETNVEPTIEVSLTSQPKNRIFLEVRDNGIGLDAPDRIKLSFGSKLIATLTKQLKAESTSFNQNGAVFQLSIPLTYETRNTNS